MGDRLLKETICQSEELEELCDFAEILFYRLIVSCDDFGRFTANARVIRGRLFPLREDLELDTVREALDELERVGLIARYCVGKKGYLRLCSWEKHQSLKFRKAVYPAPDEEGARAHAVRADDVRTRTCAKEVAKETSGEHEGREASLSSAKREESETRAYIYNNIISNLKGEEKKSEEEEKRSVDNKRNEEEEISFDPPYIPPRGDGREQAEKDGEGASERFEAFWRVYPRKERKINARRVFLRLRPSPALLREMLEGVERFRGCDQWKRDGGRFIPHAATWLSERRWEETVGTSPPSPGSGGCSSFDTDEFFAAALAATARRFSA